MATRILIVDDHGIIRAGLRNLLNVEPDFEVVGEAADGLQALRLAEELQPDLILLDISMPGGSGLDTLVRLKERFPAIHVLMLTVHEDESLMRKAMQGGASGYVVKRAAESELNTAIRTATHGDIYIHPSLTRSLLKDMTPSKPQTQTREKTLTIREVEVLRLVARGYTNNQIADMLKISSRTVEGHRANLMDKLDLHTRVELFEYAERLGMLK